MLRFNLSDQLKLKIRKLANKDRPLLELLEFCAEDDEIIDNDAKTAASATRTCGRI